MSSLRILRGRRVYIKNIIMRKCKYYEKTVKVKRLCSLTTCRKTECFFVHIYHMYTDSILLKISKYNLIPHNQIEKITEITRKIIEKTTVILTFIRFFQMVPYFISWIFLLRAQSSEAWSGQATGQASCRLVPAVQTTWQFVKTMLR